jgi:hypothetical protein
MRSSKPTLTRNGRPLKLPKLDALIAAIEADDNLGFCIVCGGEAYSVEPDGRNLECEGCGEKAVYGAEEMLMMEWHR